MINTNLFRLSTVACMTLCLAAPCARAADAHVALVKNTTGQVTIARQGASLEASPGMQLFVDDEMASAAGASAGIVFKDGTLLTLGASSNVKLRDYVFEPQQARYAFSVFLAKGSAVYSSGRIGKLSPESVKVDTPTATVGVRGTRFIIDAN